MEYNVQCEQIWYNIHWDTMYNIVQTTIWYNEQWEQIWYNGQYDTMDNTVWYHTILQHNTIDNECNIKNIQYNTIYNDHNIIQCIMDTIDNKNTMNNNKIQYLWTMPQLQYLNYKTNKIFFCIQWVQYSTICYDHSGEL